MMRSKTMAVMGVVLVGGLLASACTPPVRMIRASGNIVELDKELAGFDRVDVSHAFTVEIKQGESFAVTLTVDENVIDYLDVRKAGSTLVIGLQPTLTSTRGNITMEASVTMPELRGLELSGATGGKVTGFESDAKLDINVSGASDLRGDIVAGDVDVDASGASDVRLDGSGEDLYIDASGASTVDLESFSVTDARVNLSGASKVTVDASGTLDVDASGASNVYYVGEPTLRSIDTSGASSVRRR
jgi:hypothetical protein